MPILSPIQKLIQDENLSIHFQPIISLRRNAVVGLEALARPFPVPGTPPLNVWEMFQQAHREGNLVDLDRLCRAKALNFFTMLPKIEFPKPLLFLNFATAVLDRGVEGSGNIRQAVADAGLEPGDVVIEIEESRVADGPALERFVDRHREMGFLIAIDDMGTGDSNLPRIAALRPQILKLDRSLVEGIDANFFKQETFKSLVSLANRIGCMILAEGVETQAEVDTCATLGAELFQGYYFARPVGGEALDVVALSPSIQAAAHRQREAAVQDIQVRRGQASQMRRLSDAARATLSAADFTGFDIILEKLVETEPEIECAYVLNRDGLQITATHSGPDAIRTSNRLFSPALKGTNHSNKAYFYSLLDAGLERYTTDSYLSIATGRLCRTVSSMVVRKDGAKFILCLDLKENIRQ
jgi:EAL domain-containing protein (putative c-di-GMP-specific phosphodiesterase class I)